MKFTKKEIQEIVDTDGELIGSEDVPQNGANLETQANNTTDYNAKIGHQPFRYDMLGRFGFTLLPFFEGKEDVSDPLAEEIARYLYDHYKEMLKHYYKNPKLLQVDYRKKYSLDFENDESSEHDYEMANDILEIIKPHFEESLKQLNNNIKENVNENAFLEGKMLEKSDNKELSHEKKQVDVLDTKLKKIAGLINKLDKDEVKIIKNLLETE